MIFSKIDLTNKVSRRSIQIYDIFFSKSPYPKTSKMSFFRVPNEVRSSIFLCSLLHFIFCWLHWTSLVVVILKVDALEGVAFYYLNNTLRKLLIPCHSYRKCHKSPSLMLSPIVPFKLVSFNLFHFLNIFCDLF